jgi:cytosine/uracil/thiamine/allantoin permease
MAWFVGFFLSGGLYYLLMLGYYRRAIPATEVIPATF